MSKKSDNDAETPDTRDIDEDLPVLGPRTVPAERLRPADRRKTEAKGDAITENTGEGDEEESSAPSSRNRPRTRPFADPFSAPQPNIDTEADIAELLLGEPAAMQAPASNSAQAQTDPAPADSAAMASRIRISGSEELNSDPAPKDPERESEIATPDTVSNTGPGRPDDGTAAANSSKPWALESAGLGHLKSSERKSLLVLATGMLVVALVAFYFLSGALPIGIDRPPIAQRFPASGDKFLVKSEGLGWARVDSARERVRLGVEYVPRIDLKVEGSATGALRVVFLNELGRQQGDTVTVSVRNGTVAGAKDGVLRILSTDGLANTLEYNDLRARPELSWKVEIREGADAQADGREFRTILRAPIPWDLIAP